MSIYLGAGSTAHKMSKLYAGVRGQARQVQKVYVGVGGQARLVYQSGQPIGGLAVGSIVKIKVNGAAKDFIVVQQGNPNTSIYDSSCNGAWLLMKDIYENRAWHSSDTNNYSNSTIRSYLNSTFLNLFELNIKNAIKQVKIPFRPGNWGNTVASGSNGLSTKIFLLSATETGFSFSYMPIGEGAELAYFEGCADNSSDSKRSAYLNGSAASWWLRSPYCYSQSTLTLYVSSDGDWGNGYSTDLHGIRPALILPSTTLVDENGNVIG